MHVPLKNNPDEFNDSVKDILSNEDFQKLDSIPHHGKSILDHSCKVAQLAWLWSKRLRLDRTSTARGALLHDFFLYDWKKKRSGRNRRFYEWSKMHGFTHPAEALQNAEERFSLNVIERDIILHHMFPLTIQPPRTKEGWLVMLCDKWVSLRDIPSFVFNLLK
ncbi:HD domain-containing protein [Oceanispirochaeta crateris]|uniref:HD domain-containing protein n=1 Tax=Oceanispirochaeta crateris TaxID=2518645 RepID=A0A5C1QI17_9SPIO|nr:HD domain-containing protein [Oceanispirochaeta crateris]QEN07783.1 HD domain-containing protein [Oceanispirochaeta crateris]